MEILSKDKYQEFDTFCENHPHGAFQQSPRWNIVKSEWQSEVVVSRDETGRIKGGVMILIRKMGIKTMMYACRGPVCDYTDSETLADLTAGIKEVAKKHKAYVFIMDPLVEADDSETIQFFKNGGYKIKEHASFHETIQPRYNYMLDYLKGMSPDELIMKMDRKTRYDMRYGEKHGVVCKSVGLDGLDDFYNIYSITGQRKHFNIRPREYFEKMLTGLGENCRLYVCYLEDEPLCGGIVVQYAGTTSHVYGASSNQNRNLRATYLQQKVFMEWALEGGCHTYDMQGVAPTPDIDPELYGVLQFKDNFSGRIVETAGEFTIVFDPLYKKAIDIALNIRRKILK